MTTYADWHMLYCLHCPVNKVYRSHTIEQLAPVLVPEANH